MKDFLTKLYFRFIFFPRIRRRLKRFFKYQQEALNLAKCSPPKYAPGGIVSGENCSLPTGSVILSHEAQKKITRDIKNNKSVEVNLIIDGEKHDL